MVSGKVTHVMTPAEQEWWNESRDAYMAQTKFTEVTDMRDMDRLLAMELMVFRWTQWMSAGVDYDGDLLASEKDLQLQLKGYSDQITKIKASMVLSKDARDSAANEGNFARWFSDLKARARIFGIHREEQLQVALTLMNEITGAVRIFLAGDEEERGRTGLRTADDVLRWINDEAAPRYQALDEYFQEHEQRLWIKDQ
jgi:hypothetical protein